MWKFGLNVLRICQHLLAFSWHSAMTRQQSTLHWHWCLFPRGFVAPPFGLQQKNKQSVLAVRFTRYVENTKCLFESCYTCFKHATESRGAYTDGRVQLKCDGTRWRTEGEVKGKLANEVGSQYSSHYLGTWCTQHYYRWCAHLGCQ